MADVRFISFNAAYSIISFQTNQTSASSCISSSRFSHSTSACSISEQSVTDNTNRNKSRNIKNNRLRW